MSASSSTATAKLYARKTIQKLSTLNINASNESILTISNWIIFNRKKVTDIGDGMLLYITENSKTAANTSNGNGDGGSSEAIGRLMLLVKIINQVLLFNCPTTTMDGNDNNTTNTDSDTTDKWIKSSQLRIKLSEIVILPLWKALATSLHTSNTTVKDQYSIEIKNIVDNWKKCNVFDSVTILDEYKRGWSRALKDAGTSSTSSGTVAGGGDSVDDGEKKEEEVKTTASSVGNDEADEKVVAAAAKEENSNNKVEQAAPTSEGTNEDTNEDTNSKKNDEKKDADMTDEQVEEADDENVPVEETNSVQGSGKKEVDQQVSSSARRDSIADVEVDFEVRYNIMCVPCILMFEQADTFTQLL